MAEKNWAIKCLYRDHSKEELWWSELTGWGSKEGATRYVKSARFTVKPPIDGGWSQLVEPNIIRRKK